MEQEPPSLEGLRHKTSLNVDLVLERGDFVLRASYSHFAEAEVYAKRCGGREVNMLHVFRQLNLRLFLDLVYVCLHKHHPKLTPEEVARLVRPNELWKTFKAVMRAIELESPGLTSTLWRGSEWTE